MNFCWVAIGAACLLSGCRRVDAAAAIDLAARGKNGDALAAVVMRQGASPSERHAAVELTNFVAQITGVVLPVVSDAVSLPETAVVLGETAHTAHLLPGANVSSLGTDGFRLKTVGRHVLVLGSSVRGVLYGVYEILERFGGVRWYAAGCTKVPRKGSFLILGDLDEVQKPAFPVRLTSWQSQMSDPQVAVRNRLSLAGGAPELGGGGVSFSRKFGRCHTFAALVPVKEHFAAHPEYFSFFDGKRQSTGTQLCLTNKDMLEVAKKNLLADIAANYPKGVRYYGISQNDWYGYCECPVCAKVDAEECSHAGTNIRFVNALADAVRTKYPDVTIETLAYHYTQTPPKLTKPRDNVMICLCSIRCDFSKGLPMSRATENIRFCRDLADWSKIARRLFVWDYTTDYAHYCMPFANVLTLQQSLAFLQANGVEQVYAQGCSRGEHADWAELKAWLLAKWLWDPSRDATVLIDDFFSGYYGPAAVPLRRYFDALHALPRDETRHPLTCYAPVTDPAVTDVFLDASDAIFDEAEHLAAGTEYLARVKQARLSPDYARVMRYIETTAGFCVSRDVRAVDPARRKFLQDVARRFLENRKIDGKAVLLAEDAERHERLVKMIETFLARQPPNAGSDVLSVEESHLAMPVGTGRGECVDDPLAGDGRALCYNNRHSSWSGRFNLQLVRFDPGVRYKVRFRVRAKLRANAAPEAEVFWAGVYRRATKAKATADLSVRVKDVKGAGYDWYETDPFVPDPSDLLWSAPGRFPHGGSPTHDGVYIDRFEIVRAENPCVIPVFAPGAASSFRKANWRRDRHAAILDKIAANKTKAYDLVLLGDSLSELWEWPSPRWGGDVFAELSRDFAVLGLGYGGDKTQDVLGRIEKGELDGYSAKVISFCIGSNNHRNHPEDTAAGVKACLDEIRRRHPESKVVLFEIPPCRDAVRRARNEAVNAIIRKYADGRTVVWSSLSDAVCTVDGTLREELMPDGLHPTKEVYGVWADRLREVMTGIPGIRPTTIP